MNRTIYLIVENGDNKPKWKDVGTAYLCKDGSHNITLFFLPHLTFNCRLPKSLKEAQVAAHGIIDEPIPAEVA